MKVVKNKRWVSRLGRIDENSLYRFAEELKVSVLTGRVLWGRDVTTSSSGRSFLDSRLGALPDPFLLAGMEKAVSRLSQAIVSGQPVSVHGDFDVDGMTGTSLLVDVLRTFGASVSYHIPHRLTDGYGLSADALRQARQAGAHVALSVDCGISAIEEAGVAREVGLDLIITDHHHPPDILPDAYSVINPHLPECSFPFKDLAGVGVAFFLLVALRQRLREQGWFSRRTEPDLRCCLDLVALGTIADIVPLRGVNRTLVRYGLQVMEQGQRPGVCALIDVAGVKKVSCGAVGFNLAPRLNAAGRLEDAGLGVELLLESSYASAYETARLLDDFNRERQAVEKELFEQALEKIDSWDGEDRHSLVLWDDRWHPGVIGIVASRLVERYHRPTVMISMDGDKGKGSARSISGFHLYRSLEGCHELLQGFGGHEYAAGLSIEKSRVETFSSQFEALAQGILTEEDLLPKVSYDGEVLLSDLSREVVEEMAGLAPFGAGNPEPVFMARNVDVVQMKPVGENHLKFTAVQNGTQLSAIAFRMAERQDELQGPVDLLFAAEINTWRGQSSVQLRVKDFRSARES